MKQLHFWTLVASAVLLTATWMAGQEEASKPQVEVSGTTQGNSGCAILEKHTPVKGKLLLVGVVYARTEYRVLDSFNYKMPKSKFTGKDEIEELNHLATKDKIKLVIVPSKYTPEDLEEARKLCEVPTQSTSPGDDGR